MSAPVSLPGPAKPAASGAALLAAREGGKGSGKGAGKASRPDGSGDEGTSVFAAMLGPPPDQGVGAGQSGARGGAQSGAQSGAMAPSSPATASARTVASMTSPAQFGPAQEEPGDVNGSGEPRAASGERPATFADAPLAGAPLAGQSPAAARAGASTGGALVAVAQSGAGLAGAAQTTAQASAGSPGEAGAAMLPGGDTTNAVDDGQEPASSSIAQRLGLRDGWKLSEDGRVEMRPASASGLHGASGGPAASALAQARSGAASAVAADPQSGHKAGSQATLPAQGSPGFADVLANMSARAAPVPAVAADPALAGQGASPVQSAGPSASMTDALMGGGAGSTAAQGSDKAAPARATALNAQTLALVSARFIQTLQGRATRFDMTLTPESLGRVDVKMSVDGDGRVAARLAFDNPLAMADFRGRADELRRELESAGFTLSDEGFEFTERERRDGPSQWERPDAPGRAPNPETETVTPARWLALGPAREGVDVRI